MPLFWRQSWRQRKAVTAVITDKRKKKSAWHPHISSPNHPHKDKARLDAAVQAWAIDMIPPEGATQGRGGGEPHQPGNLPLLLSPAYYISAPGKHYRATYLEHSSIYTNEKKTAVRSRISSRLIFARCVRYFHRGRYGCCMASLQGRRITLLTNGSPISHSNHNYEPQLYY